MRNARGGGAGFVWSVGARAALGVTLAAAATLTILGTSTIAKAADAAPPVAPPPVANPVANPADAQPLLAELTLRTGEFARSDAPTSATLPAGVDPWQPMMLYRLGGPAPAPVPFQRDPLNPAAIWWILDGETPAGQEVKYELRAGFLNEKETEASEPAKRAAAAERVKAELDGRALDLSFGGRTVFRYNYGHVEPPSRIDPAYIRSGYIYPLFSPKGRLITEDMPADHFHHKGIWMPWTHTEFKGHAVDFWNLGEHKGTVEFTGFRNVMSGPVFGGFVSTHDHLDVSQGLRDVALNEVWDVRVWAVGGPEKGWWLFDLVSTQNAAQDVALKLLEYRYGGLGYRGAKEWKNARYKALSSEGKTHLNGHTTRAKWCDHSGSGVAAADGGDADAWSGVTIMDHPSNFRFPQSMRLWDKGGAFFNYAPVQLGEFEIKPGEPYVSRYRFFVHEGEVDPAAVERIWNDWAHPPTVEVTMAPAAPISTPAAPAPKSAP